MYLTMLYYYGHQLPLSIRSELYCKDIHHLLYRNSSYFAYYSLFGYMFQYSNHQL